MSSTRGWWLSAAQLVRLGLARRFRYAPRPTRTSCLVSAIPASTHFHIRLLARVRVAALYDIHGHLPALEVALADVDDDALILVGGDVAMGPWPRETLE